MVKLLVSCLFNVVEMVLVVKFMVWICGNLILLWVVLLSNKLFIKFSFCCVYKLFVSYVLFNDIMLIFGVCLNISFCLNLGNLFK